MLDPYTIPTAFIAYAAEILAETIGGLTASEIAKYLNAYAVDWGIYIPHTAYPFDAPNKRTALKENLSKFSSGQQYTIIKELCELEKFKGNQKVRDLKIKLRRIGDVVKLIKYLDNSDLA